MTTQQHHPRPSRRSVTRTAIWAVPVMSAAVGAPAFAGSGACTDQGAAPLGCPGDNSTCKQTALTFPPSSVTGTVAIASTDANGKAIPTASDTGDVLYGPQTPSWPYIKLHHPAGTKQGNTLTMTVTLSQPVRNFTFRITDIDQDTNSWVDDVFIEPQGYVFSAQSNVKGTGNANASPPDPFTAVGQGAIDGTAPNSGDVVLTWPQPISTVTIRYVAADLSNKSSLGQHIGVGQFAFNGCPTSGT